MDTRRLKPFAQQCRQRLMQGVAERMHYWGFVPTSHGTTLKKLDKFLIALGKIIQGLELYFSLPVAIRASPAAR